MKAPRWAGTLAVLASLYVACGLLIPLASTRYVHVDEAQVAYNAALLGLHELPGHMNFHAPLVVPLSWIAARGGDTWSRFTEMRMVFTALMLLNLALVSACAPRVRGWPARALVFLGALLVEPLWRHGFEIRHDVVLLATSLGLALLAQRAARTGAGARTFAAAGALAVWMQLNSFKAFLIWPAGLAILFVASRASRGDRLRLGTMLASFACGAGAAFVVGWALLTGAGIAGDMVRNLVELTFLATEYSRFAAGGKLLDLARELMHLTAPALLSLGLLVGALRRRRWRAEAPSLVLAAWLVLELLALSLNPTPFSYNLVHVLPFFYLVAVDGGVRLFELAPIRARSLLVGLGVAVAAATFARSWSRDTIGRTGAEPQRRHIEVAESLTGPSDPVLDAAGLLLSRRPPGRHWMLHSLLMPAYRRGDVDSFAEMLTADPAPVLITNYRWEWLDKADRSFVRARYVALGPRLLVLGGAVAAPAAIEIFRPGRYAFLPVSDLPLDVAGQSVSSAGVLHLEVGRYRVDAATTWAWVGPQLSAPPDPGGLFPNRDLYVSD